MQLIGQWEGKGIGVNFKNWTTGLSVDDNFTMISVLIFLVLDNFIYLAITFYVERINPGQHGIAKPWHFPVSSCVPGRRRFSRVESNKLGPGYELEGVKNGNADDEIFIEDETVYSSRNIGIKITNLVKIFKQFGKVKAAVNDLCLNIYENHITVLLGKLLLALLQNATYNLS